MSKLKLESFIDDRPVKLSIELPAGVHRDLVAYATILADGGATAPAPDKLIAPMLERFMATDREFRARRRHHVAQK